MLGTPSYMSPEQFTSQPVDGRSDLFSCGVILYQLLTGEKPFTGESTTTIMYKVLREEPVPPSELNLALTPELDAVLKKALAKSPAQRFQSGREFSDALQAAIAAQPVAAAPAGVPAQPAAAARPAARPGGSAGRRSPQCRPRRSPGHAPRPGGSPAPPRRWRWRAGGYLLFAPGRQPAAPVAQGAGIDSPPWRLQAGRLRGARCNAPAAARLPSPRPSPEAGTLVISALGLVDPQRRAVQRRHRGGPAGGAQRRQAPADREGAGAVCRAGFAATATTG